MKNWQDSKFEKTGDNSVVLHLGPLKSMMYRHVCLPDTVDPRGTKASAR